MLSAPSLFLLACSAGIQVPIAPPQISDPGIVAGIQASPRAIDFAPTEVAHAALPSAVTVRNTSSAPQTVLDARVVGPDAGEFTVLGFPAGGLTLRPGGSTQIQVAATPTVLGLLEGELLLDTTLAVAEVGIDLSVHSIGGAGSELLIDVGGPGFASGNGDDWSAGYGTSIGSVGSTTDPISGTQTPELYQTWREAPGLRYDLPVPPGVYELNLHFVEPVHTAAGQRSMTIWVGSGPPDTIGLDPFAAAGGKNTAHVETYQVTVVDGLLELTLIGFVGDAILSGIELRSFPLLDVEPEAVAFGAVGAGSSSEQWIQLTNFGGAPLAIDQLGIELGAGEDASAFEVTLDGATFQGADTDQYFPVDVDLAPMEGATLAVRFEPLVTALEFATLELTGNFGSVEIPLDGLGGHEGHPFLHVVIDAPQTVVDYIGGGTAPANFDGSTSHTHEPGFLLSAFDWYLNGAPAATGEQANLELPLGTNTVELEIFDNHQPPDSLRQGVTVEVVPVDSVPGVLIDYFDYTGGSPSTGLSGALPAAVHVETWPSFQVFDTGSIGSSDLIGDALVRMRASVSLDTAGTYEFATVGGASTSLTIDGVPAAGPQSLTPGDYAIEARFAVQNLLDLPLEVTVAVDGGPATGLDPSTLLHDQGGLPPTINSMPGLGTSLGGNAIEILGLGYFPQSQVVVHWGATDLGPADFTEQSAERIRFESPPGQGLITVTVETPNGVSNARTFLYDDDGPVPINFSIANEVWLTSRATAADWGPDGRLYVGQSNGQITAIEFDADYQTVSVTDYPGVSGLPNHEIMGLTFDPYDTNTGQVRVYVDHTTLFANGGSSIPPGTFSSYPGQVSALVGPAFDTPQPVITKLPTSNHDHANNGLVFDHDGSLLISVGSQTNAGIPHPNSGDLPESPLSAAIVRASIFDPSFDGDLAYANSSDGVTNLNQVFGETVDLSGGALVDVYAPGIRNAFGLALHTNGYLYTTDNGPNFGFGPQSTGPTTIDADPYSSDKLLLIEEGNYYGSPNRNRGRFDARQNVYRHPEDDDPIPGEYTAPLGTITSSQNGVAEYRSDTFQGQLRGNLITQKWANTPYRMVLSEDGRTLEQSLQVFPWTGSLQLVTGPGGALLALDYFNQVVKVLVPDDLAALGLVVHDITPWRAPKEGGSPFVIAGVGFGDLLDTTVAIGGVPATLTSVSATRIEGIVPADLLATTDLLDVEVNVGVKSDTLESAFRYLLGRGLEPGRWDADEDLPTGLADLASAFVGGELLFVGDGDTRTLLLDPLTGATRFAANDRPHPGSRHAAEVVDDKLYLVGGMGSGSEGTVQIYDPSTEQWSLGAPLPWAGGSVSTATIDGQIYAAGGIVAGVTVENVAVYDPTANLWTSLPAQPAGWGRNYASAGTDGERFWIFGGRRGDASVSAPYADVFAYDPQTGLWETSFDPGSTLQPMPVPKAGSGRAVHRFGRFYVVGGETDVPTPEAPSGIFDRVDVYDVSGDAWIEEAPVPTPRRGVSPVLFESRIFVGGGSTSLGSSNLLEIFRRI